MKKLIAVTLLCATSAFASDINEEAKGNWTGSFKLMNGTTIEHTPEYTKMGFIQAGTGISFSAGSSLNGYVYQKPLNLRTNSTRAEFIEDLMKSGLYQE